MHHIFVGIFEWYDKHDKLSMLYSGTIKTFRPEQSALHLACENFILKGMTVV